jgi:O-acetyl-ADP-ribose deacetylase (regulator of RNase III)
MPLSIIRNDITKMNVGAIVNAANTELKAGGGVCGAIFTAAGVEKLQKACDKLSPVKTGDAVLTKGYSLPAKYIIHAAGPVYKDGKHDEEVQLRSCYTESLNIAKKHGCDSIAFPLISSGIYGYPKDEAITVATSAISDWLMENDNDIDVSLVVFDKAAFALSNELHGEVKSFIDQNYVDERNIHFARRRPMPWDGRESYESEVLYQTSELSIMEATQTLVTDVFSEYAAAPIMARRSAARDDLVVNLDESFATTLLRLIDSKGKTDVEVYKRANLDRKLFSKIRKGKGYMPSKKTVVALAVALELSLLDSLSLRRNHHNIILRLVA